MKKYTCIFFDLDHTLWDYESNSEEALRDLFAKYKLQELGIASHDHFIDSFKKINSEMWNQYDNGIIQRSTIRYERFNKILLHHGVNDYETSLSLSEDYMSESPRKKNLMPHSKEVLNYLHAKYPLYIITNGFEDIQAVKLASTGIQHYFKDVITSQKAGHKKPSKEIFEYALRENGFQACDSIMIGDSLATDILGARNSAIDAVFYNPLKVPHEEKVDFEIHHLSQLLDIL